MKSKTSISRSPLTTLALGKLLGRELISYRGGERGAFVVALSGELAAGKTLFTRGIARGLGIKRVVHSPTFLLMKRYPLARSHFKNLWHVDCYRIKNFKELEGIGFAHILADPKNIVVIEWPDCIKKFLPRDMVWIYFSHKDPTTRRVLFKV